jgi:hemin uptake protein HemP
MKSEPIDRRAPKRDASPQPAATMPGTDVVVAGSVFGNRRELLIAHAGSFYRLRITQNNKLILTK